MCYVVGVCILISICSMCYTQVYARKWVSEWECVCINMQIDWHQTEKWMMQRKKLVFHLFSPNASGCDPNWSLVAKCHWFFKTTTVFTHSLIHAVCSRYLFGRVQKKNCGLKCGVFLGWRHSNAAFNSANLFVIFHRKLSNPHAANCILFNGFLAGNSFRIVDSDAISQIWSIK